MPVTRTMPRAFAAFVVVAGSVAVAGSSMSSGVGAQAAQASRGQATTTTSPTGASTGLSDGPGQTAYVTPNGDVMVTASDGEAPRRIGTGAATNASGLAPMAWRQPAADAVAYVRRDRALVVAPTNGDPVIVLANDAVVPADADESIISWDLSGSLVIYLAETRPGRVESRMIALSTAKDGEQGENQAIGDVARREVLAQTFSPLDPYIIQRTRDVDTGGELTLSLVNPSSGSTIGTPFSLDDPTFSPDGRYLFAVSRGTGAVEQLVRVSIIDPTSIELVADQDRICTPRVSPDARRIVYGGGAQCEQVWVINADGTEPTRLGENIAANQSFAVGTFSWSADGKTVAHAACTDRSGRPVCGGKYWDVPSDGSPAVQRAQAGSVLREFRSLLRPIKATIEVKGPISYTGTMQVGAQSIGGKIEALADEISSTDAPKDSAADGAVEFKAIDEVNNARSFEMRLFHGADSSFLNGTLRIIDGGFDHSFNFFGRLAPRSYGFVKLRGIWMSTAKIPFQAGHVLVTLER